LEIAKEISKRIKDDIKILAVLGCTFKQDKEQPEILDISYCQHHLQRVVIPGIQTKKKSKYSSYELQTSAATYSWVRDTLKGRGDLIAKRSAWVGTTSMIGCVNGIMKELETGKEYIPNDEDRQASDWLVFQDRS